MKNRRKQLSNNYSSAHFELAELRDIERQQILIAQRNGLQATRKKMKRGAMPHQPEDLEATEKKLRTLFLDHPWLKRARMPAGSEAA